MSLAPTSVRAAFFLSLGLVTLGSCGVTRGLGLASTEARPMLPTLDERTPALDRAQVRLLEVEEDVFRGTPRRRALGVADVVVSMMLIIGSFLLITRHTATEWWVKNAVAANVLVLWITTGMTLAHAKTKHAAVVAAIEDLLRATASAQELGGPEGIAAMARTWASVMAGSMVAISVVVTLFHLYVGFRVSRADVKEYLASRPNL